MQTNCVELPLDSVHLPLALVGASLRCIVHTILMLRLPQDSCPPKGSRTGLESEQLRVHKAQPAHAISRNGKLQMQAKAEAAEPPAGPTLYQGVIENKKGGDLTVALSSLRSSPSTERSTSSSSGSSSKYQNGRFESQKWDYPQLSSLLESSEVREKLLQRDRPETHESLQRAGDLPPIRVPRNSGSSNSSSSRGGSDGCIYIGGFAEGRSRRADFRLQAHASTPLSLIYLRPCEAPHLAEEVERKLRAFIGLMESGASLQQHQPQAEYTVAIVLYIQRPKAFGFLSSSVERVSFERWMLPLSICWCTHSCSSCCTGNSTQGATRCRLRGSSCCCSTTQCCQDRIVGSRQSCLSTTPATKEAAARGAKGCGTQHVLNLQQQTHQQQQQQQQRFAECLPQELRQQQEVEKAIRRVLFAVVEMATARQFHLPPPNVSRQLYGYDVVLSGRQAPHLGGWALQLPQAVRLL